MSNQSARNTAPKLTHLKQSELSGSSYRDIKTETKKEVMKMINQYGVYKWII